MNIEIDIRKELHSKGADIVHFVDVSDLDMEIRQGFPKAVLIGIKLTREYLKHVHESNNYVAQMIQNEKISEDEFYQKELGVDNLADQLAMTLKRYGYNAYSQSESNHLKSGRYNQEKWATDLPHKAIALRAGIGWIGKNNLLINTKFGCALCMCTVLTDAPLETVNCEFEKSKCGECNKCQEVCSENAIKGTSWKLGIPRDEIVDVSKCTTCLKCLVFCMWTEKYINLKDEGN